MAVTNFYALSKRSLTKRLLYVHTQTGVPAPSASKIADKKQAEIIPVEPDAVCTAVGSFRGSERKAQIFCPHRTSFRFPRFSPFAVVYVFFHT